jgi:hypothetical protein
MARKVIAAVAAFAVFAQDAAFARQSGAPAPNRAEVTWNELEGFVVDKLISTVLPDGAKLRGEVLAVRPESLVLDVQKSSRKKLHPLGQTEIARTDVREIYVIRHQSAVFRVLGGVLGGIGGLFAATGIAIAADTAAAALPALLLLIPASAAAGYYAGKLADRRTTRITIRPEFTPVNVEEE